MADIKNYMVGEDENTVKQINQMAQSTAYHKSKIRIMPDAHAGKGCVVGSTMTFTDKICPNTVGVDIACRVSLFDLSNEGHINLAELDTAINKVVPAGFNIHNKEQSMGIDFPYEDLYCWKELKNHVHLHKSLGTLGGGNHMIELDQDAEGNNYLLIHCGTRNLGKQVAEYYQKKAIAAKEARLDFICRVVGVMMANITKTDEYRRELIRVGREAHKFFDEDNDLCYIEGEDLEHYLHDMALCNKWSELNHLTIYDNIAKEMNWAPSSAFANHMNTEYSYMTCIHNYVDVKNKIIRKGAISARAGEFGIIPLNMRDGVLIVEGLGNEDWNCSLPHGAGRILSRAQAKRKLTVEEYTNTMSGIYSSSIGETTLDEAPMAYKDANAIIEAIGDNAKIICHLRPVYNFKAH